MAQERTETINTIKDFIRAGDFDRAIYSAGDLEILSPKEAEDLKQAGSSKPLRLTVCDRAEDRYINSDYEGFYRVYTAAFAFGMFDEGIILTEFTKRFSEITPPELLVREEPAQETQQQEAQTHPWEELNPRLAEAAQDYSEFKRVQADEREAERQER